MVALVAAVVSVVACQVPASCYETLILLHIASYLFLNCRQEQYDHIVAMAEGINADGYASGPAGGRPWSWEVHLVRGDGDPVLITSLVVACSPFGLHSHRVQCSGNALAHLM